MLERLVPALAALLLGGCADAAIPSGPLVTAPSPEPTPTATATVRPTASVSATPTPTPTTEIETDALHASITYAVRVQAVRATMLGTFVVGETDALAFTVP